MHISKYSLYLFLLLSNGTNLFGQSNDIKMGPFCGITDSTGIAAVNKYSKANFSIFRVLYSQQDAMSPLMTIKSKPTDPAAQHKYISNLYFNCDSIDVGINDDYMTDPWNFKPFLNAHVGPSTAEERKAGKYSAFTTMQDFIMRQGLPCSTGVKWNWNCTPASVAEALSKDKGKGFAFQCNLARVNGSSPVQFFNLQIFSTGVTFNNDRTATITMAGTSNNSAAYNSCSFKVPPNMAYVRGCRSSYSITLSGVPYDHSAPLPENVLKDLKTRMTSSVDTEDLFNGDYHFENPNPTFKDINPSSNCRNKK